MHFLVASFGDLIIRRERESQRLEHARSAPDFTFKSGHLESLVQSGLLDHQAAISEQLTLAEQMAAASVQARGIANRNGG